MRRKILQKIANLLYTLCKNVSNDKVFYSWYNIDIIIDAYFISKGIYLD